MTLPQQLDNMGNLTPDLKTEFSDMDGEVKQGEFSSVLQMLGGGMGWWQLRNLLLSGIRWKLTKMTKLTKMKKMMKMMKIRKLKKMKKMTKSFSVFNWRPFPTWESSSLPFLQHSLVLIIICRIMIIISWIVGEIMIIIDKSIKKS